MAKRTTSASKAASDKPKFDLRQTITDKIVEMLEGCTDPWQRPWVNAGQNLETPINGTTGKAYRGTNVLLLWGEAQARGFKSAKWATFDQWFEYGGGVKEPGNGRFRKILKPSKYNVRKGETSEAMVVYARKLDKDKDDPNSKGAFLLRYTKVFNADQVEGYEDKPVVLPNLVTRHEGADEFFRHMLADYKEGFDSAYYSPSLDHVRMPAPEQFKDTKHGTAFENFYSTKAHEFTHWTGHESRLKRDMTGRFDSQDYAREELIAELGAAFLCSHLGISAAPREDHAIYIKSWIKALKNDKGAIFTAAAQAQKAVDFMIAKQPSAQIEDDEDETLLAA